MYRLIVSALLVSLASGGVIKQLQNSTAKCDPTQFNTCIGQFAKTWNLTAMPNEEPDFEKQMDMYLKTNLQPGFKFVCGSLATLEHCLGSSFKTCMSEAHLQSAGLDKTNADLYATLVNDYSYECGPGYKAIYDNFDCIETTTGSQAFLDNFKKCLKLFMLEEIEDPSHMCQHLNDFTKCYSAPFSNCSKAAAEAECNVVFLREQTAFPQCTDNECSKK